MRVNYLQKHPQQQPTASASAYIIYFPFSESSNKHIAKAQTASIRCVENLLSVKLFAQGQRQPEQEEEEWMRPNGKKGNTQKKGAQNNCGKTQGNQERGEETRRRKAAATQKQLAKTQARLPPSCCRPNVLENFLLHEVITTLRKAFFLSQCREICASTEKYATLFFNGSRVAFMSKKLREKNK